MSSLTASSIRPKKACRRRWTSRSCCWDQRLRNMSAVAFQNPVLEHAYLDQERPRKRGLSCQGKKEAQICSAKVSNVAISSKDEEHTCPMAGPQPYPIAVTFSHEPDVRLEIEGSVIREPVTSLPSWAVSLGEYRLMLALFNI